MSSKPRPKRKIHLERIDDFRWRIPREGRMRTDGLIFADDALMEGIRDDPCLEQVANVAELPGIVGPSMAMPDIHWGYGFPIGGVAAFDAEEDGEGIVSPGGVGFDINCGIRLLSTDVPAEEIRPVRDRLVTALFDRIPTGVGAKRSDLRLSDRDLDAVMDVGAAWAVRKGYGLPGDAGHLEAGGRLDWAVPSLVSRRSRDRGRNQLGTLGSGNHFVEVGVVDEVRDEPTAHRLGLDPGTVTVLIHCGSRGLGYQVCHESIRTMDGAVRKYGFNLPDRQLCCAPIQSPEGKDYMGAMAAAANFAFANRQVITHQVREAFGETLGKAWEALGVRVVYDVCHNIAKFETHTVDGKPRRLCVHRKGATRAFPPGHPELPESVRDLGQPVLVPGDMGRYSYVLLGTEGSMKETWGSCCHGAGRKMGRKQAKRSIDARKVLKEMEAHGISVRGAGWATLAEEVPGAYKDVAEVVKAAAGAGIGRIVARLRPIGVIKG